tara:strand:+ start:2173 stop:2703 length:531 start_codon:yes stop_codon:yes gene_type:complete
MMLSDATLRRLNLVSPVGDDQYQPASIDVRLGYPPLKLQKGHIVLPLIRGQKNAPKYEEVRLPKRPILKPGDFLLGRTLEKITLPSNIAAKFEGKSSLGRVGLMTHVTAGFIDPGFDGVLTLELYNVGPATIRLSYGMKIGQIAFYQLDNAVERPYGSEGLGSHYQGAVSVEGAKR